MKTNRNILIKVSFILSICLSAIGFWLSLHHETGADIYLIIGLIFHLTFLAIALFEIFSSSRISTSEKIIWTIGLVILSSIGGLIYLLVLRKNVDQSFNNKNISLSKP
jgi:heme/copper-type cytochrome/quinol oxidase subunit 4